MNIKQLLSFIFVAVPLAAFAQDIEINEENFPDENFRSYVLGFGHSIRDGFSFFTEGDIAYISEIDVSYYGGKIKSLKGIEFFTALTYFKCSNNNQLTSLDLSSNTKLTYLDCSNNQLTSLDLSNNTRLTYLDCSNNQLTSLDLSNNTRLTYLYCPENQLASLDITNCHNLKELDCNNNDLVSLDISKNLALTRLSCGRRYTNIDRGNKLVLLDISNNTALTYINCSCNQLTSLDISNNIALDTLDCSSNQLTSIDVSSNLALGNLICYENRLTSLDVSNNTELTTLACWSNQLKSLDVSNKTKLTNLYCSDNQLTFLDVSNNTKLRQLYCEFNQLTSLYLPNNSDMWVMDCSFNQLTVLDVSKNTGLWYLYCNGNKLTYLDVSKNTELFRLCCFQNQIKGITMDALLNSLPTPYRTSMYKFIISSNDNETNICTYEQVESIKEKGWTPDCFIDSEYKALYPSVSDFNKYMEYDGCDAPTTDIVSVGTEGLSTYCPAFDMDFSNAKEIEAYKVSVSGINLYFDKVTSVAAGEGVLLRSVNGGEATEVLPIKATEKNEGNEFVGVLEAKVLQEKEGNVTNFILSKKNGEIGFYKANKNPIAAWKAYLPVTNYNPAAEIKGFNLIFRDPTTGIEEIETLPSAEEDAIYTLSGIRVTNPTKGIYIKNGKKVVVK